MSGLDILWLTPDKPENISVGRLRISRRIEAAGHTVEIRGSTLQTALASLRDGAEFDVVVGTTRLGAFIAVLIGCLHGVPVVVDHVDPIRQLRETDGRAVAAVVERLENVAFRLADHVVYVYPEEAARIERRASRSTRTDLGVDYQRFADPSPPTLDTARDNLGALSSNVVIYVGGLEPMYSIEAMLASVAHLDDWTLLVAGAGSLEPAVEDAAANSDTIRFLGLIPHEEIPGYLRLADVGIALVDDPHTLKVLEYGAAGLPVVQQAGRAESRFGGLVEYTSTDTDEIAAAVKRAARGDTGSALQQYVRRFDWEQIAETYIRIITTVK